MCPIYMLESNNYYQFTKKIVERCLENGYQLKSIWVSGENAHPPLP